MLYGKRTDQPIKISRIDLTQITHTRPWTDGSTGVLIDRGGRVLCFSSAVRSFTVIYERNKTLQNLTQFEKHAAYAHPSSQVKQSIRVVHINTGVMIKFSVFTPTCHTTRFLPFDTHIIVKNKTEKTGEKKNSKKRQSKVVNQSVPSRAFTTKTTNDIFLLHTRGTIKQHGHNNNRNSRAGYCIVLYIPHNSTIILYLTDQ